MLTSPTIQEIKITVIVDNNAAEGLASEHGLALWIETGGHRILYDTGPGAAFESNVQALGLDLSGAHVVVLSHGHYDHTGGLAHAWERAPNLDLYCHPAVTRSRYAIREGKASSIGMPSSASAILTRMPVQRLHWVQEPVGLTPTVGLTGPVPRFTSYEDTGGPFFLDVDGKHPDCLEDDLALWVHTEDGLVVCLGCCHAGLVNTLGHIARLTGDVRVRAIIGGLHLVNAGAERLEHTVAELKRVDPEVLVACHCSGESAVAVLREALGERVLTGAAGLTFCF